MFIVLIYKYVYYLVGARDQGIAGGDFSLKGGKSRVTLGVIDVPLCKNQVNIKLRMCRMYSQLFYFNLTKLCYLSNLFIMRNSCLSFVCWLSHGVFSFCLLVAVAGKIQIRSLVSK